MQAFPKVLPLTLLSPFFFPLAISSFFMVLALISMQNTLTTTARQSRPLPKGSVSHFQQPVSGSFTIYLVRPELHIIGSGKFSSVSALETLLFQVSFNSSFLLIPERSVVSYTHPFMYQISFGCLNFHCHRFHCYLIVISREQF